jgi:transcriptional regulator with PAS, ATPase and Fis domain
MTQDSNCQNTNGVNLFDWMEQSPAPAPNLRDSFTEIVGRSASMVQTLELVSKIAKSDGSVLVYGESGTGKELIASAIHRLSPRSTKRFVAINCSAIPEDLLESELFGHEKGAFTGATTRRTGYFEMAKGGTILLDEIGDMPLRLQAKILRVLQEKQFFPVGSNEARRTDIRIIAATNVNLQKAVENGAFRLDLYYRLNVLPVQIEPLRERTTDIEPLLFHFLEISNAKHNISNPCYFNSDVVEALKRYPWPGNVRELQNLVERLVVIRGAGLITLQDLPQEYRTVSTQAKAPQTSAPAPQEIPQAPVAQIASNAISSELPREGIDLIQFIENLENQYILQALEKTGHNKNQAARLLGLNRTTLVERIKKRKLAPLNMPSKEL